MQNNKWCHWIFYPMFLIPRVRLHPRISSEDKPLENFIVETTKVDCTSGSNSSEQQNLLTHPRAKGKCWWFFGFHNDDNEKIAEKKQVHCWLCSITLSYFGKHHEFGISHSKIPPRILERYQKIWNKRKGQFWGFWHRFKVAITTDLLETKVNWTKDRKFHGG